jgi:DNA-directed RNA polymerase specialized sigma24 family protein
MRILTSRTEGPRSTSQEGLRSNEIAELRHRDASKRESRRVVAQGDPLQCAEEITRRECTRCGSDQQVHRNPVILTARGRDGLPPAPNSVVRNTLGVCRSQASTHFGCHAPNLSRDSKLVKPVPGTLQEGGASFQTTHWTLTLRAGQTESSESAQQALSAFCETYWPPLYAFLRHRRYAPADAQDLVQAFFLYLFEKNTLERADREKGRLRTFLLTSLQNFLINEYDREKAIKRGGDRIILSLDELLPEAEVNMLASAHLDDVACYDLTWATSIVARSWQKLCEVLEAEGKSQWLDELRPFLAGGTATPPNQEEVAARIGVPIATLRTWISRLRQRYRNALRTEVASTVSNPADIEDELKYLYRILVS